MSYRSYVVLPKKRKKLDALLRRTQRFKDMRNLRAVVLVHKRSGLLIHTESYSFLDDENKLIFTGFTQASVSPALTSFLKLQGPTGDKGFKGAPGTEKGQKGNKGIRV